MPKKIKIAGVVHEVPDHWGPSEIKLFARKLKQQGATPATTEVAGQVVDAGVAEQAPQPPATMEQMVSGERPLNQGYTLNPRTGVPQTPISDAALPEMIETVISGGPVGKQAGRFGGPLGAAGGAALGMAGRVAGDVVRAIGTNEPVPTTPGEAVGGALEAGGVALLGEGAGRGVMKGVNLLRAKVPVRKAVDLMANQLAEGKLSPKQFGDELKALFDTTKDNVGAELRAFTEELGKNPAAKVKYTKALDVLEQRIAGLKNAIGRKPNSGSIDPGTGKDTRELALKMLQDTRNLLANETVKGGESVVKAIGERSDAFKMGRNTKGELAGIEKELATAIHEDITTSLKGAGLGKEAGEFEKRSSRFREIADLGEAGEEANQLAKIFGDKRIESEAVGSVLANIPEKSVQAIELLRKQGNKQALKKMKGAIFESLMAKGKLTQGEKGISDDVIEAVFDTDAKKVQKFITVLDDARNDAARGVIGKMLSFISVGKGPARVGINDASGPILEIAVDKLATVLDNPEILDAVSKGFSKQPTEGQAAQLARILFLAISKAGRGE